MEIDPEIHRRLIVHLSSLMTIKSLRKQIWRSIDDLLSIFVLRYLLRVEENKPGDPQRTYCLYSWDVYSRLKGIDQEMQIGLIVYIPSQISIKSLRKYKEMDPEIHRGLIVDILSQISIKSLRKQKEIDPQRTYCLYSLDIYSRSKEIDQDIHRGLIVYIPSQISIKSLGKQKEIDPEIHRGLIVDIPSQISMKSLKKIEGNIPIEDLLSIFLRYLFKA